jgi:VIT1/CCC1 family predicted Fe2+/Mn2+ transporter
MVRYLYSVAPLVIVGAVVLLAVPWLALIALVILALATLIALGALASAIVFVPYKLSRAIGRHWQSESHTQTSGPALSIAERKNR